MIALECPNCARRGSVPNDKVSTRLVCKKCHIVFHMAETGRPVIGEPPAPVREKARRPGDVPARAASIEALKKIDRVEKLFEINRVKVAFASMVVGIVGVVCLAVMATGGQDDLTKKAEKVAASLMKGDPSVVQGLVKADGATAVAAWFDATRRRYETLKTSSPSHEVHANHLVTEENHSLQRGEVIFLLIPASDTAGDQGLVKSAGAAAAPLGSGITQIMTYWVLDNGSWRIDAGRTANFASAGP